jgi:hypothetical protein
LGSRQRRLTYEVWKAVEVARLSWSAVIQPAGGDVESFIRAPLDCAADQFAEHV